MENSIEITDLYESAFFLRQFIHIHYDMTDYH